MSAVIYSGPGRVLREPERELLKFLLARVPERSHDPDKLRVYEMEDGGMGSLRFVGSAIRRYRSTISECEFTDKDGVGVNVALIVDQEGSLFELDIWKYDFSPVIQIPPADRLRIVERQTTQ